MSEKSQTIRAAIAAKIAASAGCTAAGLRRASTAVDEPLESLPELRVLLPASHTLTDRPGGWQEFWTLAIPAEIVMPAPSGRWRADPTAGDIADAIQAEFRSGIKLGLPSYVVECIYTGWTDGLQEYADTELPGIRIVFDVHVLETLTTIRTV